MAAATWASPTGASEFSAASSWSAPTEFACDRPAVSLLKSHNIGLLDDEGGSSTSSQVTPPSAAQRFLWQHIGTIHALQEVILLLLLGVVSNLLAFTIDNAIDILVTARARVSQEAGSFLPSYLVWTGSSLLLCALSAACIQFIGPSAAGSGIPQMKCVLAGMQRHDYLSARTLFAKTLSLVLALGGGLSIGKEGPYVHVSSCIAAQLWRLPGLQRLGREDELRRQVLAAGCAAGVSATFGAPVGGVLFSIEVTSTYYSISHLWKALFTSVCGALIFRLFRDRGTLALFNLTTFSDTGSLLYNGEIFAFTLLGVICGLVGAGFVHATASLVQLVRDLRTSLKDSSSHVYRRQQHHRGRKGLLQHFGRACDCSVQAVLSLLLSRYGYTLVVAFTSAMLTFPFGFFRSSPQEVCNELFGSARFDLTARWSNPSLFVNLIIYTVCKFVFTCIAVGCPISCGVFTPVFLIGAAGGRCFGELLNMLTPLDHHITAGSYAVVGAAALAASVTRTVSTAVIVFELTGQLNLMLPVLVAVLSACGVGNFINSSIYDTMMQLNNLPYLKPLTERASLQSAQDVMDPTASALRLPCTHMDIYRMLSESELGEFAVLGHAEVLLGSISRAALEQLLSQLLLPTEPDDSSKQATVIGQLRDALRRKQQWLQPSATSAGRKGWGKLRAQLETYPATAGLFGPANAAPKSHGDDATGGAFVTTPLAEAEEGRAPERPKAAPSTTKPPGTLPTSLPTSLSQAQLDSLQLPVDFGIENIGTGPSAPGQGSSLINWAPTVVLARTSLRQVHVQFSLFSTEQAYVTFAGRYIGIIQRLQLTQMGY